MFIYGGFIIQYYGICVIEYGVGYVGDFCMGWVWVGDYVIYYLCGYNYWLGLLNIFSDDVFLDKWQVFYSYFDVQVVLGYYDCIGVFDDFVNLFYCFWFFDFGDDFGRVVFCFDVFV